MKRPLLLFFFLTLFVYLFEISDILGFNNYKPHLSITHASNEYVLTWNRVPYFTYYEIEVLNKPPEHDRQTTPSTQRIVRYRTLQNHARIDQHYPFQTYWRVSAHSLFRHPLGAYSNHINLAQITGVPPLDFSAVKPQSLTTFSIQDPATLHPVLRWTEVPGAVYYEFELLNTQPENPNGITPSRHQLFLTREVFTSGFNIDLTNLPGNQLFWRARALDYDGNPIGVFSDATEIIVDRSQNPLVKPTLNVNLNQPDVAPLLYPVYAWIPVPNAISYEVELLNELPEIPNNTKPSAHRIWSKEVVNADDCYDEEPRNIPGTYYWRVRGLDRDGKPVGVYSDVGEFVVDLSKKIDVATFGDSITHGGGAVSYSPCDWAYDYQTYLNFATVNLGKSGDTSETMLERLERDVLPYKPKMLIIMGGTNSLRGGVPAIQVIKELTMIRDKCLFYGIRPIFLTLPPINPTAIDKVFNEETVPNWREQFDQVNSFIRQQRYCIDLEPFFSDSNGELPDHFAVDGLHYDIEGKKLMAQIININWPRVSR